MSNALTVFATDSNVVFNTKTGVSSTSPEGALFKGGAALASLKDLALDSAIHKAANGRYTAAVDILEVAFPKIIAVVRAGLGATGMNKSGFKTLITFVENAQAPSKGFSKKQIVALSVVRTLRNVPALAKEADERVVIEMA